MFLVALIETFIDSVKLTFTVPVFYAVALIIEFFTSSKGNFHFCKNTVVNEKQERNYGKYFCLDNFLQIVQLSFVEKQLAFSFWLVVVISAKGIFFNGHIDYKKFATFIKLTKTFGNRGFALSYGFYLGSG